MGLEGVSATVSATIMLVEIVTALAISIGFLGESLTLMASIGAALVLTAVYLVSVGVNPQEKPSMSHT
jgi:drug/metabolite transporter (DMT)-like permease